MWFKACVYQCTTLSSCGGRCRIRDEEEQDVKLLCISGKQSAPKSNSKVPQKKGKFAPVIDDVSNDVDGDDEKAEGKPPVKKSVCNFPVKNAEKSNQSEKDSKL